VNPYDVEKAADAIHRGLEMPLAERRTRMKALAAREREHDVHAWVASFLEAAAEASPQE
jgi:trehalose-6-phosphate synthase